jgi:uncharacterized protein (TIGR03000 family)
LWELLVFFAVKKIRRCKAMSGQPTRAGPDPGELEGPAIEMHPWLKGKVMRSLLLSVALALTLLGLHEAPLSAAPPGPQPATVLVYLPADARLTVDGEATTSTTAVRRFITPPLEPGKVFHYTFAVQVTRDDRIVSRREEVKVRAGEETVVSLWPAERNEGPAAVEPAAFVTPSAGPPQVSVTMPSGLTVRSAFYPPGEAPRAPLFSEQSPMYGAGPIGSYAPWATGTLIGR